MKNVGNFYEEFTDRNNSKIKEKIKNVTIGIAGCGGLGSNVAIALVRSGLLNIVIADADKIETSNLNRQQYTFSDIGKFKTDALKKILEDINPFCKTIKFPGILTDNNIDVVFGDCSIVIEAFDNVAGKSMLINKFSTSKYKKKYLITASGVAGVKSSNEVRTIKIAENIYACGDLSSNIENEGVMAPKVLIVAGHQANIALEIIINGKW